MHNLFDLTGKNALITGSSQGLGYAMAKGLAQAGATVILNGRDESKLANALAEFTHAGLKAHGYAFDVIDSQTVKTQVAAIEREVGQIDILVNNAGIQRRGPLEDFPEDTWREVIDVNLHGPFIMAQAVIKPMIARRQGKIINIASLMSEVARNTITPYVTSKGGLKMMTKGMATEWGKHNIQVNGIGPGYFVTELNRALIDDPAFNQWVTERTPAGRWGDPSELVGVAVFLASSASNYVNGQIIYVDGGMLARL